MILYDLRMHGANIHLVRRYDSLGLMRRIRRIDSSCMRLHVAIMVLTQPDCRTAGCNRNGHQNKHFIHGKLYSMQTSKKEEF